MWRSVISSIWRDLIGRAFFCDIDPVFFRIIITLHSSEHPCSVGFQPWLVALLQALLSVYVLLLLCDVLDNFQHVMLICQCIPGWWGWTTLHSSLRHSAWRFNCRLSLLSEPFFDNSSTEFGVSSQVVVPEFCPAKSSTWWNTTQIGRAVRLDVKIGH